MWFYTVILTIQLGMEKKKTLITGIWPPNIKTTPIWRRILKVSLILLALNSLKLSAQSPPCNKNALPIAASASFSSKLLASPAKTIGGNASRVLRTESKSSLSGYSGSCKAFFDFQLSTVHFPAPTLTVGATVVALVDVAAGVLMGGGDLEGSAEWTAEMRRVDLEGLVVKKQGWWGLLEGIKDLEGIMELLVRDIVSCWFWNTKGGACALWMGEGEGTWSGDRETKEVFIGRLVWYKRGEAREKVVESGKRHGGGC